MAARVRAAEDELLKLKQLQEGSTRASQDVKDRLDAQQLIQRMLVEEVSRQGNTIQAGAALTREILSSRIWRSLTWLGGILLQLTLRLRGRSVQQPTEVVAAGKSLKTPSPLPIRASASHHPSVVKTLEEWQEI